MGQAKPAPAMAQVLEFSTTGRDEARIAGLRNLFGRSSIEARWARMSDMQRAVVCYAARIAPRDGMGKSLADFSDDQREALRAALTQLLAMHEIWGMGLDRRDWLRSEPQAATVPAIPHHAEQPNTQVKPANSAELARKIDLMRLGSAQ